LARCCRRTVAAPAGCLPSNSFCQPFILKIRTLEMPFPAIWALNYELQFDFKKEIPWKLCHISKFDFFAPLLTKANRGAHPCAPPPPPYKSTPEHFYSANLHVDMITCALHQVLCLPNYILSPDYIIFTTIVILLFLRLLHTMNVRFSLLDIAQRILGVTLPNFQWRKPGKCRFRKFSFDGCSV
jgi:hypothetical protein